MTNLYPLIVITFREYRFVIYWLMDLSVVGYYRGFTYKHPITITAIDIYSADSAVIVSIMLKHPTFEGVIFMRKTDKKLLQLFR